MAFFSFFSTPPTSRKHKLLTIARASQTRHYDLVVDVVLLVVRLVHGVVRRRLRLGIVGQPLQPPRLDAVPDLDDHVADEADAQHDAHDVQLLAGAQVRAVRVRHHEAGRLPQPVVAERRLLVAPEQRAVDACETAEKRVKLMAKWCPYTILLSRDGKMVKRKKDVQKELDGRAWQRIETDGGAARRDGPTARPEGENG